MPRFYREGWQRLLFVLHLRLSWRGVCETVRGLLLSFETTGVVTEFNDARAAEIAVKLLPATKHIFLAGGGAPAGRTMDGFAIGQFNARFPTLTVTDLSGLTLADRIAECTRLPPDSIIVNLTTVDEAKAKPVLQAIRNTALFSDSRCRPRL